MADRDPRQPNESFNPSTETDGEKGPVPHADQTGAKDAEKNLPRGSEPETHARK